MPVEETIGFVDDLGANKSVECCDIAVKIVRCAKADPFSPKTMCNPAVVGIANVGSGCIEKGGAIQTAASASPPSAR